ncbi:isopentenyl-diphosphate delta-isomerase [Candidatus Peregrinibacteria bacterium CG10_big_fil_rev_8_21_14_0_10_49_10]|nr:MAG: isopentenyl-diphosphate delta-isomerase [Candidatus Peregrinibacteria bacterium CG10_big_fil_rev_8_21_14_0_10_49_10]
MRQVILTDTKGNQTGLSEIMQAHTGEGKLHRAFSVYIFRKQGTEILMQKRSSKKMLFPLLWANTCCSHPFPDEAMMDAAQRRLQEECGLTCDLKVAGTLVYRAEDPEGRGVEHEHVTLLRGDDPVSEPKPDSEEIEEIKWMPVEDLLTDMEEHPKKYAPWFHLGLQKLLLIL